MSKTQTSAHYHIWAVMILCLLVLIAVLIAMN
jgi:hypothetical protein